MKPDIKERSERAIRTIEPPPIVGRVNRQGEQLSKTERLALASMSLAGSVRAKVTRVASFNLSSSSTPTAVTFTLEETTSGLFDISTPTYLTIAQDGDYLLGGGCSFATANTGRRVVGIGFNGSLTFGDIANQAQYTSPPASGAGFMRVSHSGLYRLTAGTRISLNVAQDSGGALSVTLSALWLLKV